MKTRTLAVLAASALALSLSGCGKSGSSQEGGSTTSGSSGTSKTIASTMTLGAPAEFKTRPNGLAGLKSKYGVTFGKFVTTDTGGPVTITQLKNDKIQAANIFTTDPAIKAEGFVVLADPKNNFEAQNVTPIVNKAKATPGVKEILNAISAKLTTNDLMSMVGDVQNDHKDPADVAKSWLTKTGLGKPGSQAKGSTLTVGSANFPENVVLAQIYAQALKAGGANVSTKLNIGSREKYFPALKSGSIDVFPEYNGATLTYLDNKAPQRSTKDINAELPKVLPKELIALTSSPAEDRDAIVVTKATADKYGLKSIGDLAKPAK